MPYSVVSFQCAIQITPSPTGQYRTISEVKHAVRQHLNYSNGGASKQSKREARSLVAGLTKADCDAGYSFVL